MAHRTPQSFLKRQRERARAEKAAKKEEIRRQKSAARRSGTDDSPDGAGLDSGLESADTDGENPPSEGESTTETPGSLGDGFRDSTRDV